MKIEELKKIREKEIKEREDALSKEWLTLGTAAFTGIICSILGFTANGSLLALFQLPAVVLVPGAIIGFFVMIYRSSGRK